MSAPAAWRGQARTNKYGARRTTIQGQTFDSNAEAKRWVVLSYLQKAGEISQLRRQVRFPLYVFDWHIGDYIADFVYLRAGNRVVEDVKGRATELFRWKAKHFAAQYQQEIEVVK